MKVGVCGCGSGAGVGSTARGVPTRNTWALDGVCGGVLGNQMILDASPCGSGCTDTKDMGCSSP